MLISRQLQDVLKREGAAHFIDDRFDDGLREESLRVGLVLACQEKRDKDRDKKKRVHAANHV
jgi:hypothetical protein